MCLKTFAFSPYPTYCPWVQRKAERTRVFPFPLPRPAIPFFLNNALSLRITTIRRKISTAIFFQRKRSQFQTKNKFGTSSIGPLLWDSEAGVCSAVSQQAAKSQISVKSESSLEHKSAKKLNTAIALFFVFCFFFHPFWVPEALYTASLVNELKTELKCDPTSGQIRNAENLFWIDQKTWFKTLFKFAWHELIVIHTDFCSLFCFCWYSLLCCWCCCFIAKYRPQHVDATPSLPILLSRPL